MVRYTCERETRIESGKGIKRKRERGNNEGRHKRDIQRKEESAGNSTYTFATWATGEDRLLLAEEDSTLSLILYGPPHTHVPRRVHLSTHFCHCFLSYSYDMLTRTHPVYIRRPIEGKTERERERENVVAPSYILDEYRTAKAQREATPDARVAQNQRTNERTSKGGWLKLASALVHIV